MIKLFSYKLALMNYIQHMRMPAIASISFFVVLLFSSCSVLKVHVVNRKDVVGEWLLTGLASTDKVYQTFPHRETILLYENDSCVVTSRDQNSYKGTYKLDGNYLTIKVKPGWIERYQIVSLRDEKMEVSASSEQSLLVPWPGGFLSWQKID